MLTPPSNTQVQSYTAILQTNRAIYNEAAPILARGHSYEILVYAKPHDKQEFVLQLDECISALVDDVHFNRWVQNCDLWIETYDGAHVYLGRAYGTTHCSGWNKDGPLTGWIGGMNWVCSQSEHRWPTEICYSNEGEMIAGGVFSRCLDDWLRSPRGF